MSVQPPPPLRMLRPNTTTLGVNSLLPGGFLGLGVAMNVEGVLDGRQKENNLAFGPDSPCPPRMTHCDPETRAPVLTCCSRSHRKLTSCFRLPHSLGLRELRPPPPIVGLRGPDGRRLQPIGARRRAPPARPSRLPGPTGSRAGWPLRPWPLSARVLARRPGT